MGVCARGLVGVCAASFAESACFCSLDAIAVGAQSHVLAACAFTRNVVFSPFFGDIKFTAHALFR